MGTQRIALYPQWHTKTFNKMSFNGKQICAFFQENMLVMQISERLE